MHWLLAGYIWLYIHRPFEFWPALGVFQVERIYMLAMIGYWLCFASKGWVSNRLHFAFLAFLTAVVLCWFASPYFDKGAAIVEDLCKIGVFYVLVITTVREERGLRRLLAAYLVAVGLYMVHSLWEFQNGRGFYRMDTPRMIGVDTTFSDPNTFAATLLYSLLLTLPFWFQPGTTRGRALLLGYTGLTVLCVLLTGSRTGFVGLCYFGAVFFWRTRYKLRFAALVVLAAPLAWLRLGEELQARFTTIFDPSAGPANAQQSALGRLQGLLDGIDLWSRSPLTGVGPNAFGVAVGHGYQAHNLYGQTLGELGTLGALGLAAVLLAFAFNAVEVRRLYRKVAVLQRDLPYEVSLAVLAAIGLLLLMGIGGHNLYRYTWMWFGAFQAIALHCARRKFRTRMGAAYV